jgi:hypothetical protein
LGTSEAEQLAKAEELATVFAINPCTPDIYTVLVQKVATDGLYEMLRAFTVPPNHNGYELGPFQAGADLAKLNMSPADAESFLQEQLAVINRCIGVIYGPAAVPCTPPARPLLQCVVDLVAGNIDKWKLCHPAAPAAAGLATAAADEAAATA